MRRKPQRLFVPAVLWLAVSALGCVAIAPFELNSLRDDFEINARIAHRLLSQRAVQHDAVRQHVKSRKRNNTDRLAQERFALLSERERQVLGLIVAGLTNKEIGRALDVSQRTVETHRANLFAKLEAESLAQLIRRYAGLVEGDS